MVPNNPVTLHQVTVNTATREIPKWISNNLKMLRDKEMYRSQITDNGLWIVTKTYTAPSCAVSVMSGRATSVGVRLTLTVEGILTIDPGFGHGTQASGTSSRLNKDISGFGPEPVVIFMSGIYIKRRWFGVVKTTNKQEKQKPFVRGEEHEDGHKPQTTISVVVGDQEEIWEIQEWGTVKE